MGGTRDYRMTTADATLRRALERRGDELWLTLDPAFQGFPDAAHGGTVLAAFDAIADLPAPRHVAGQYRKRVPVGEPLRLVATRSASSLTCRLLDAADVLLVDGSVTPAVGAAARGQGVGALLETDVLFDERFPGGAPPPDPATSHPLPVSKTCFACGTENSLGLRVQLAFDETTVGARWQPREVFQAEDGTLAPVALAALLDEAAFWLGALASGESGMTTDLRLTLVRPAPFGASLAVGGARSQVRPRAADGRYWDTRVVARDGSGVVAAADITFVAVRGAARRLIGGMLAANPPELVRRVFPAYAR
jgi:hypothetical protein